MVCRQPYFSECPDGSDGHGTCTTPMTAYGGLYCDNPGDVCAVPENNDGLSGRCCFGE